MAKTYADEALIRQAIRARMQGAEPGPWSTLHRAFGQVPERTFYNWVKQECTAARTGRVDVPPLKTMVEVEALLSSAALQLAPTKLYRQVWNDYQTLRQESFTAPEGLDGLLLRRTAKLALRLLKLALELREELLIHNKPALAVEGLTPVLNAMERGQAKALAAAMGKHAQACKREMSTSLRSGRARDLSLTT